MTLWEDFRNRWADQAGYNDVPEEFHVSVEDSDVAIGEYHWEIVALHLLTGAENHDQHNVFLDAVSEGTVVRGIEVEWGWEGMRPDETPGPVKFNKPVAEYGGDIGVHAGQVIWARVAQQSDQNERLSQTVKGFDIRWAGPGGGNEWGHWSLYVLFKWKVKQEQETEPEPNGNTEPEPEPGQLFSGDELIIIAKLTDVVEDFDNLPVIQVSDSLEFKRAILQAMRVIVSRPGLRELTK